MAKKVITAHELARQLLAGPDVEVWARNPSDESYPLYVKKIEGIGQYGSTKTMRRVMKQAQQT